MTHIFCFASDLTLDNFIDFDVYFVSSLSIKYRVTQVPNIFRGVGGPHLELEKGKVRQDKEIRVFFLDELHVSYTPSSSNIFKGREVHLAAKSTLNVVRSFYAFSTLYIWKSEFHLSMIHEVVKSISDLKFQRKVIVLDIFYQEVL